MSEIWRVGEPISIISTKEGCSGPDKLIPSHGDLERLLWACAVENARYGLSLTVTVAKYTVGGVEQHGFFNVETQAGCSGPFSFPTAWSYITGYAHGFSDFFGEQAEKHSTVDQIRELPK